jgi:hypothetical protein
MLSLQRPRRVSFFGARFAPIDRGVADRSIELCAPTSRNAGFGVPAARVWWKEVAGLHRDCAVKQMKPA